MGVVTQGGGHAAEPRRDPPQPGTPNTLTLPEGVTGALSDEEYKKFIAVQIAYARDSALLQSSAYDDILKITYGEDCPKRPALNR